MTVTAGQPRLLTPPRLAVFCPAVHCGRACSTDCTCFPCRCTGCLRRTRKAGRLLLTPERPATPIFAPQPRLFPTFPTRSNQPKEAR